MRSTRRDFQALARLRLAEAQALFDNDCPSGAYYLAGYAVECALKARIAKETQRHDFPRRDAPQCYTHNLRALLALANLEDIESLRQPSELRGNWNIVKEWNEQSRYRLTTQGDARKLLDAVKDRRNGVLPWVKKRW